MMESLHVYRKVVMFDNPRIGMSSDASQDPLTVSYMGDATLNFIKAIELERPDVLGFSLGADVALDLVAKHGSEIGNVVAIAGSYGGPKAPQPEGGLGPVLAALQAFFLAKYAAPSAASADVAPFFAVSTASTTNETDIVKLFFPLGSLDPGKKMEKKSPSFIFRSILQCYIYFVRAKHRKLPWSNQDFHLF